MKLTLLLLACGLFAQTVDPAHKPYLPDPKLTPGDVAPVTKADVCVPNYTAKVRDVPWAVRVERFAAYGVPLSEGPRVELDHAVPLSSGGSNSPLNLWVQPYRGKYGALHKDDLENILHRKVCRGEMELSEAQEIFKRDWVAGYIKYALPVVRARRKR